MNHKFDMNPNDKHYCRRCARDFLSHSDMADCESCKRIGPCELLILPNGSMLLCDECYKATQQKIEPKPIQEYVSTEHERLSQDITKLAGDIEYDESLTTSQQFFNRKTESLIDREKRIMNDNKIPDKDDKIRAIRNAITNEVIRNKQILFSAAQIQVEIASENRAIQYYLNDFASRVSKELRKELHLDNPSYIPKVAPAKVAKVKMTPLDREIGNYAKRMNIPLAKAKELYMNNLRELQMSCTCMETPGICKMHGLPK
jgi:hypothetical protein